MRNNESDYGNILSFIVLLFQFKFITVIGIGKHKILNLFKATCFFQLSRIYLASRFIRHFS